jgi:hypothetical protein
LTDTRFAENDFSPVHGEVSIPLHPDRLPEIIEGLGDLVRLDAYLRGLPGEEREHVLQLFYSGNRRYIEDQVRLARESRAVIDQLPDSADKKLILDLFQARSEKEVLKCLGTSAIADLPTEIIRAARRIQAGLKSGRATQNAIAATETLIRLQTEFKQRHDFLSLTSDGFIRTNVQHIPGHKILDTLRERWGTTRPDIVVAGAGPTGIVQALLYGLLGYKVLLVDKGFAGATWADKLNLAVHVLRSPAVRNDIGFASFPLIERLIGFKDHLPLYRLLAQTGRAWLEEITGIEGYADSGLPKEVRELTNTPEAKGDVLAQPSSRGELYLQLFALLNIAISRGNVILLEETPVTKSVYVSDRGAGHWDVTFRTDDPLSPELTLSTTHPLHNATGFSGTRGEFSNIPHVFEEWATRGSHFLVRDGFELDQPATLEHLSHEGSTPLIVTSPLVGHPAFIEYVRGLPEGTKVAVVGDGESALKTLKTLSDLNPKLSLILFAKEEPKETGRYYTAGQNRRLHVEDFLRHPERHGPSQLTQDQRKAGFISPQSMADYTELRVRGNLTLHVQGRKGFNEHSNPELFRDIHGPWVIAAGFATPEERLPLDPVHAGLLANGRSIEDSLNPVAALGGRLPLHLGNSFGPTYTGPVVRIIALAYITGSFGFSWAHALYNALDYFFKDHSFPVQPLVIRDDNQDGLLKPEETELYDGIRDIFHSPEYHQLIPAVALPRVVYEGSAMPSSRIAEMKALFPEGVVEVKPESDPAKRSHLDYALNKEVFLELIPGLREALSNPGSFVQNIIQKMADLDAIDPDFSARILALQKLSERFPHLSLPHVILRVTDPRGVVVMDPADYEKLFAERSLTRRIQNICAPVAERFQGEPRIIEILQKAFTWILLELRAPLDLMARLSSSERSASVNEELIKPLVTDYAVRPIQKAFAWNEILASLKPGEERYLVVFRSQRKPDADGGLLDRLDEKAHQEALQSGGLLAYFRGPLIGGNHCLSFCVWKSRAQARQASAGPLHQIAAQAASAMYSSFTLERYTVRKKGHKIVFAPIRDSPPRGERSGVVARPDALGHQQYPIPSVEAIRSVAPTEERPRVIPRNFTAERKLRTIERAWSNLEAMEQNWNDDLALDVFTSPDLSSFLGAHEAAEAALSELIKGYERFLVEAAKENPRREEASARLAELGQTREELREGSEHFIQERILEAIRDDLNGIAALPPEVVRNGFETLTGKLFSTVSRALPIHKLNGLSSVVPRLIQEQLTAWTGVRPPPIASTPSNMPNEDDLEKANRALDVLGLPRNQYQSVMALNRAHDFLVRKIEATNRRVFTLALQYLLSLEGRWVLKFFQHDSRLVQRAA